MKLFFHFPPNNDMMDTGSIKRKGKMPLFWHFMAAEKTENWMLHRKVSTTMNFIVPAGYTPDIDLKETQIAIKVVKDFFQKELTKQLNLTRVSAPLFVTPESGLNDNLNGVERPVAFDIKEGGRKADFAPAQKMIPDAVPICGRSGRHGLATCLNFFLPTGNIQVPGRRKALQTDDLFYL